LEAIEVKDGNERVVGIKRSLVHADHKFDLQRTNWEYVGENSIHEVALLASQAPDDIGTWYECTNSSELLRKGVDIGGTPEPRLQTL
jgi:hypothetical protein